uniref:non-specific serine/threonine protein kinase n=1 Tax=Elaeis guineensis var. tenera TaxID=51953 RepID=A0A8N4IDI1_ELAGV|nr:putative receptor-like protein kinase At3g47110 [Elaeis guineensis]
MPSRVRLTDADIRQHTARKRPAPVVGPSWPPKRPQIASPIDLAAMGAQPDAERASGYESIIALSVPMVPPEVPFEEGAVEGAAEGASALPPTEEVRAEAREPKGPAMAAVVASGGTQSSSSFPSLFDFRAWAVGRGKAPMASGDDTSLENLAKAEENLSSTQTDAGILKAEVESAREALDRAVKDFHGSEEYREDLLESGFASYRVGYENALETIQSLHSELDLSGIVPPGSEDQAAEEEADPPPTERVIEDEAPPTPVALSLLLFPPSPSLLVAYSFSNRTDQEALLSFKSLIINDPSNTLSSWNDSSSVCQWPGVFCNHHGGVSALDLGGLGLTGSISPHIGNLSTLRFLCLQDNHFTGTLPDQLGNLLHLQVLNVSSNFIGGAIPSNMSKSSNLITLDLSANNISGGIPAELGLLSKIQVLKLGSNQLTEGIPSSMGNLSSLTTLDLGTNMLSGSIPTELGRLRNLKQLQISVNNLTGTVPPSLYNVSSLETFALAANNLYGEIPSDVGLRLPTLKVFHCCFNEFTGPYPPTLHNITKLQSIRLSHNFFAGSVPPGLSTLHDLTMYNIGFNRIVSSGSNGLDFITSLTNSTKLRYLAIDENLLEGVLPESVGNLSNTLSKFYMGGNRIYGSIPASIAQLTNLTLLNMSHNSIFGEIPLEIGQLKQLQMLGLARNSFSGEIPAALGNLTMLTELELYGNKLEGSIPAIFSQFQRLLTLDLSNNNLKGSIPRELFALTSLSSLLNLSRNSLTGPLPEDIGRLENLAALDLSNNFLSGYISNSIGNCRSLETLSMSNNSFSGLIPNTLGNLKGLQSLDLSSNQLSGSIPESLGKLRVLQYLNLSFNDLEGEVPKDGIFRNLSNVHLEGNARLCTSYLCPRSSHRSISVVLLVIIVASVVSALCFLCLLYFVRREINTKVLPTADSIKGQHRMILQETARQQGSRYSKRIYRLLKQRLKLSPNYFLAILNFWPVDVEPAMKILENLWKYCKLRAMFLPKDSCVMLLPNFPTNSDKELISNFSN